MDTLDENMLRGMNENHAPSESASWFEFFQVPVNPNLPKVNVVFVDVAHQQNEGTYTYPVRIRNVLDNRFHNGVDYRANIPHLTDACDASLIPNTICTYQDAAFTAVLLEPGMTVEQIKNLEKNIISAAQNTKVFFVGDQNDFTTKKRPFATEIIPTVTHHSIGEMAKLEWDTIVSKQEKPRKTKSFTDLFTEWFAPCGRHPGCSCGPF